MSEWLAKRIPTEGEVSNWQIELDKTEFFTYWCKIKILGKIEEFSTLTRVLDFQPSQGFRTLGRAYLLKIYATQIIYAVKSSTAICFSYNSLYTPLASIKSSCVPCSTI